MAEDLKVNSNTDILEFKRKFNLFVSNYDKGEFDGDFEITGDLDVGGDVEITGDLEIKGSLVGAETQIANAVSSYISEHPFAPEMLEGQDVDCDELTANSIIEKMTGYAFSPYSSAVTPIYAGVVKNGNKITFVIAGNITTAASHPESGSYGLGIFTIPSSIGDKLYPIVNTRLADTITPFISNLYGAPANAVTICLKDSSTILSIQVLTNQLAVSTTYEFRYEITFLLSDNLYNPGE